MCLEALIEIGGNAYITLIGDGKALEKIDTLHDCPPCLLRRSSLVGCEGRAPMLRATPFALERGRWNGPGKIGLPPEALHYYRAKNGGADGSRTHDLLNAIQALSQLSYGPTRGMLKAEG